MAHHGIEMCFKSTLLTFCMDWIRACHTIAQASWAEGGYAKVQPTYLGLPTLLLGCAQLDMPKQLIVLVTAGV